MNSDDLFKQLSYGAHKASLGQGWWAVVCYEHESDSGAPMAWCDAAGPLTESEANIHVDDHNDRCHSRVGRGRGGID